jgi:DNA polymerase-1
MPNIFPAKHAAQHPSAALVQRPTKWGNPFVIGRDGTREEVVAKHAAWVVKQPWLMSSLWEISGKDLLCCAERPCHAETLLVLANPPGMVLAVPPPPPPLVQAPPPPPPPSDDPWLLGVDSETALIQAGNLAPPAVCWTTAQRAGDQFRQAIFNNAQGIDFLRAHILNPAVILVIHNAPFDMGVLCNEAPDLIPAVFDAYRAHRIRCTIVRQKLIDIAKGERKFRRYKQPDGEQIVARSSYGLDKLVAHYYSEHLEKKDTWRLSYALLRDLPVEEWPPSARNYALKDAVEHLRVYEAQEMEIQATWGELPNQAEQQRAAFVLHLMSMWGVRAEGEAVDRFIAHCEEAIAKMKTDLADTGIFKGRFRCTIKCGHTGDTPWNFCPDCGAQKCTANNDAGTRDMSEIKRRVVAACTRRQVPVPMTDPSEKFPQGQVQTDKESLEATDDTALHVLASQMTFVKHLGQWGPVCARYDLVETGRTSCSGSEGQEGSNFQNPPRSGDVRPCFIPRVGWILVSTDADTIELRAHAQNCLELVGWSKMAEALWDQHKNNGPDLHLRLGAQLLGIDPYVANARKKEGDVEVAAARQFAKVPNFGFPGGLGAETMILYAAAQMDKATHKKWFGTEPAEQLRRSTNIREVWFNTWSENDPYFKIVGKMIGAEGSGVIRQLMSGRIRGDCRFTAAANGFFQGRVADAMKDILFQLAWECYTGRCATQHAHGGSNLCTIDGRSILFGSRPVLFLHDEPILEHPEDGTESDRAMRQQQIVVENLSKWMPDIPCTSSAVLMRRWQKGAEPLKINGRLVPVKPEKVKGADGKFRVKWVEDRRAA